MTAPQVVSLEEFCEEFDRRKAAGENVDASFGVDSATLYEEPSLNPILVTQDERCGAIAMDLLRERVLP